MTDPRDVKPGGDLPTLLGQLRARAQELPAEHRAGALGLVTQLETQFASSEPHVPTVKAQVSRLSSFAPLVPLLEAIAERLAGTGI